MLLPGRNQIALWGAAIVLWAVTLTSAEQPHFPDPEWETVAPSEEGMNEQLLQQAHRYALTGEGSGLIVHGGRQVMAWGDTRQRYDLKSTTKSIGVTALGLALADGKVRLDDRAVQHHPSFGVPPTSNRQTGWIDRITLRHLATQTAGFEKPGGYTSLVFAPGTKWAYSDGGPNWLAECLTLVYRRDMQELLFERVFSPLGIKPDDLKWRKNAYRDHRIDGLMRCEFGSGVHANVDAMAQIGQLYLHQGRWKGDQILPRDFVALASKPLAGVMGLPEQEPNQHGNASDHYGLLWWNNGDGTMADVPQDAFWSWGLYDSLIVVIPSLDLVVARAGKSWQRDWDGHYQVLEPFLNPIVASVRSTSLLEQDRLGLKKN